MIFSTTNVLLIVGSFLTLWVTGYGFGKAVAWVRAIRGAV